MTGLEIVAWIGIPVFIFVIGLVIAAIKGIIAFTRYMVRSEELQSTTATTNTDIRDRLDTYISLNDSRYMQLRDEVIILKAQRSR